jgi:hypothetical protein
MEIYPTVEPIITSLHIIAFLWMILGLMIHECWLIVFKKKHERRVREDFSMVMVRIIAMWLGVFSYIFSRWLYTKVMIDN